MACSELSLSNDRMSDPRVTVVVVLHRAIFESSIDGDSPPLTLLVQTLLFKPLPAVATFESDWVYGLSPRVPDLAARRYCRRLGRVAAMSVNAIKTCVRSSVLTYAKRTVSFDREDERYTNRRTERSGMLHLISISRVATLYLLTESVIRIQR